jgi:hypothetical protein
MARPGQDKSEASRNGMVFAYVPSLSTRDNVQNELRVALEAVSKNKFVGRFYETPIDRD